MTLEELIGKLQTLPEDLKRDLRFAFDEDLEGVSMAKFWNMVRHTIYHRLTGKDA